MHYMNYAIPAPTAPEYIHYVSFLWTYTGKIMPIFLFYATTQQISTEFGIESLHLGFDGSVYFWPVSGQNETYFRASGQTINFQKTVNQNRIDAQTEHRI